MMKPENAGELDHAVEDDYIEAIRRHAPQAPSPQRVERRAFYDQARAAYAVLQTGETRPYGNIILRKGVTR